MLICQVYWKKFVAEILEKGNKKINGVKFVKNEEINNSLEGEIYKITEIYSENEKGNKIDSRIILTDSDDKTFSFETEEFSFKFYKKSGNCFKKNDNYKFS